MHEELNLFRKWFHKNHVWMYFNLYFESLLEISPNVTAYEIFLTTPATVAAAERSFSKLKVIKNCDLELGRNDCHSFPLFQLK